MSYSVCSRNDLKLSIAIIFIMMRFQTADSSPVTVNIPSDLLGHTSTSVDITKFNALKAGRELDLNTGFTPDLDLTEKLSLQKRLETPDSTSEEVQRVMSDERFKSFFTEKTRLDNVNGGLSRVVVPMILFGAMLTSILLNKSSIDRLDAVAISSTLFISGANTVFNAFIVLSNELMIRLPGNKRIDNSNARTAVLIDFLLKR
jgi:hypothetical protein